MLRPNLIRRLWLAIPAAVTVLVAACGSQPPVPALAVGTTADPETTLLAQLYAAALRYYGTPAHVNTVADPLAALDSGAATVVPGFTGELLQTLAPGSAARSDRQVYRAMVGALPEGIAAGDYSSSTEDKPALAVTDATAKKWGSRDLTGLGPHCAGLSVGALTGSVTPSVVGTCALAAVRRFPDAVVMFDALRSGSITAAWTTTATAGVPDGLVILADRKPELVQAENVVPLYRRNELGEFQLRAINELAGVLDTRALTELRGDVANGADPKSVAENWLAANPLGH